MIVPAEKSRQFVSYAQNFEDVILWRALKHVSPGCYVDIGAQDPVTDSVSLAFYECGWRGVHVEPNRNYAERLRTARPDEQVIEAAIGTTAGMITFFDIPDTGLSTGDPTLAEEHQKQGFVVNRVDVPCMRLSDILDELGLSDIHWLKIDVEGMEREVISSWQPSILRPWIVVVESTEPNTRVQNFVLWENSLIELGYEFVYFDGLNRFYLSVHHQELKEHFGPGPNVFDDFTLSGRASAPFCRGLIRQIEVSQHETELRAEQAEIRQLEAELRAEQTYASRSWRVTRPLRAITGTMRWLRGSGHTWLILKPGSRPRRVARGYLNGIAGRVRAKPGRYALAVRILQRLPWLNMRLRASLQPPRPEMSHVHARNAEARAELRARQAETQMSQITAKSQVPDMPVAVAKIYEQLLRARLDGNTSGETR